MKLIDVGISGTFESSDIMITLERNTQKGIIINLKSTVKEQFGKQIVKVIEETLKETGMTDVIVYANDKGALDCTIKARILTAVYRASRSTEYVWGDVK
ncbi:MAG: citrate lyase acyl carrier protein [Clostridia bacterium]|nr:citrate lyase acyl carrier protein [Clostridia bacterium]